MNRKTAADGVAPGTGTDPDVTSAPVPTSHIPTSISHGKRGPAGMAPKPNYSRVNTGTPAVANLGESTKALAPPSPETNKLGSKTMDKRASIHGLVQGMFAASAAVLGGQAKHASEGSDPLEPKDDKEKGKEKSEGKEKDSCKVATEDAARTVQALRWTAEQIGLGKVAMGEEPGQVPNRPSPAIGNDAKDLGGKSRTPNFSDTPTNAEVPGSGSVGATTPQVSQDSPLKTAASTALGAGAVAHHHYKDKDKKEDKPAEEGKTTTASLLAARPDLYTYALQKRAADQKDVPGGLTPRPTGENVEPIPGGVPLPKTNDAPSKLTADQVHAQERKDLKTVFKEPAQTLATDPVLSHAFAHKDGEKAASETVLSARGLLARLGAELDEENRRAV